MAWEITTEELLVRYDSGERNFAGVKLIKTCGAIDLKGLNLQGITLRGADLTGADLTGADLTGADLTGAVLVETYLERATIRDANLYSANLHWCNLVEADLLRANLDHVNATSAFFCGAINIGGFEHTILAKTNFKDALIPNCNICRGGNLIWDTTMSDGTIVPGPQFGDGQGR